MKIPAYLNINTVLITTFFRPHNAMWKYQVLIILLLLGMSFMVSAQTEASNSNAATASSLTPEIVEERQNLLKIERETTQQQQSQLDVQTQELAERIAQLQPEQVSEELLKEAGFTKQAAQLELDKVRVTQQNLTTLIREQRTALQDRRQRLETLQATQTTNETEAAALKTRLEQQQIAIELLEKSLGIEQLRLANLQVLIDLLEKKVDSAVRWENEVTKAYELQQKEKLQSRIQEERQNYFNQASQLQLELSRLPETAPEAQRQLLKTQIQVAEYRAQWVTDELKFNFMNDTLMRLKNLLEKMPDRINQQHQRETDHLKQDLTALTLALSNRIGVLQQQLTVQKQRQIASDQRSQRWFKQEQEALSELTKDLQQQLQRVTEVHLLLLPLEMPLATAYANNLRNRLMQRRQLPENMTGWQTLLSEISEVPHIFWQQTQFTVRGFLRAFQQIDEKRWSVIILVVFLWLIIVFFIRYYLMGIFHRLNQMADMSSSARSLLILLKLLHINRIGITLTGILLLMIWLADPPYPSVLISVTVALLWLGIKFPVDLAWLILHPRETSQSEQQVDLAKIKLYRQLRWMVILTSSLIMITTLGHILPIGLMVQDLIDTGFMLFLSITIFPIMHIRHLLIGSLKQTISGYWLLVIRLTTLMIPLALLAVALMGLIGYLNLGWYVAWRLGLFLFIFVAWLVARGLLQDIIKLLKNFALKYSEYGLLWTQDIIPLLDKLLGVGLAIGAIFTLFWINGWFNDEVFMSSVKGFFDYTVFTINEANISIGNVLLSIFTFWAVFWFSSWSKRVTYRWIYSNILDLGVRSSLSIFTQYIVLVIGLLIALKIMGINLTTLMVLLGGLGVGIGFGLQNIVNNFVSGILLLVERPLRTGDIVNVGGNEGEVTQIGMRSLTIKTWNKQDVIVPNSELITNSFVNWTHSDKVLRVTLYIGVSYNDDPHHVKKVMTEALNQVTEILKEPPSTVSLWEFMDSAVSFRVDYYFDLSGPGGLVARDAVLFSIWDALRKEGITIPYPQRDIHVLTTKVPQDNPLTDSTDTYFKAV
ncbi:hypothetical protein TPSD3_05380 [Thioflexithrix psekupsensis]|uniref:Mechanosensitive ion channel protein MscS n=2 Tax=Thioflexithrix psekupsensis TaxID=1570016 RepID=A0A251X765_9GAMM|nr:hypothetical protein TPSD3_05380 [Thioflexithrix psekupsensis]